VILLCALRALRAKMSGSFWFCIVRVASFEGAARKRGRPTPRFRLRLKRGYTRGTQRARFVHRILGEGGGRAPP